MKLEDLKARIEKNKLKSNEEINESPFSAYIFHYNLTNGVDKLATFLLYFIYIKFMQKRASGYVPLKSIAFYKELKKHLKSVRWGKQRYYLVNKELLKNITEELEFEAKINKKRKSVPKRTKK